MSELLQIIIDFNIQKLCPRDSQDLQDSHPDAALPLQILFDSLIKFLNAFQIQSALNKYRIYLALPRSRKLAGEVRPQKQPIPSCHLLFPLEDAAGDASSLQRFAFKNVRDIIYDRVTAVLSQQLELNSDTLPLSSKDVDQPDPILYTSLGSAFLKAICHANYHANSQKLKQTKPRGISGSSSQSSSFLNSRVLVIQLEKDDPSQYAELVNGIFAAQKLHLTIDALVLRETWKEYESENAKKRKKGAQQLANVTQGASRPPDTPYLMIQAAQQTNGIFRELSGKWCDPSPSVSGSALFFELINHFLPSPLPCRQILRLPTAQSMEQVKTSSTSICHDSVIQIGYACSNCLALHCCEPVMSQLRQLNQDKKDFEKQAKQDPQKTIEESIEEKSYPKLKELGDQNRHARCQNCNKQFV